VSRAFQLPASWSISGDVVALDDGSIVLRGLRVGADGAPNEWFLLRLRTDGSAFTGALPTRPLTVDLDGSFTAGGFVQLEDGQIVEYDLPD
jgi:hypothetical protein